ncbi:MAG: urease accessory protein [Pseudorhodobacter sp.]|jgi:urease accessory protein
MTTLTTMPMTTTPMTIAVEAYLTLAQWLSPAYPVGGFAYSHGLETAIVEAVVTDEHSLRYWLADVLEYGSGRNDALFLLAAYRAETAAELLAVDASARAFAASGERLQEASLQGQAFARTTAAICGHDLPDLTYPVAIGRAAKLSNLPKTATAAVYLHAFTANLVSVAVRLVPLGQTAGQRVTQSLHPLCQRLAEEAATQGLDALSSSAFLSDIAAMRHETLDVRIFRT